MNKRSKRVEVLKGNFTYSGIFYELEICKDTGEIFYKKAVNKCFIETNIALVGKNYMDLVNNSIIGSVEKLGTCVELCKKIINGKTLKVA